MSRILENSHVIENLTFKTRIENKEQIDFITKISRSLKKINMSISSNYEDEGSHIYNNICSILEFILNEENCPSVHIRLDIDSSYAKCIEDSYITKMHERNALLCVCGYIEPVCDYDSPDWYGEDEY